MGSLFRSEDMTLCQLYLQAESAYACVSELGELGIVQFKDLNEEVNAFQKKFVNEVRRCEEMERQLRYFEKEAHKEEIPIEEPFEIPEAPAPRDMIDLEATYEKLEGELKEIGNNIEALNKNYTELMELKNVLSNTATYFDNDVHNIVSDAQGALTGSLINPDHESRTQLGFVAGVILREKLNPFMRIVWLACRGNVFTKYEDITETIEDNVTGITQQKSVFIIFFQGEQLKNKIRKICDGFRATLYPCPEDYEERREMSLGVLKRLQDLDMVLQKSREQRLRVLATVGKNLSSWFIKVRKIKAIYHTMNMFGVEQKGYISDCWVPVSELDRLQNALHKATEITGTAAPSLVHRLECSELPTYHRTNKFTKGFQTLIDAYGVASYKEVNPTPFTIISFPFLFSVMFGDFGHGLIMTLFALWMVLKETSLIRANIKSEIWTIIFGGRYIILLMGLFSMHSGLIYNDCFSKSLNIFGSSWSVIYDNKTLHEMPTRDLDPNDTRVYSGSPYPFGMDPVWQISKNKITYLNSYKKKLSVILGVAQMLFGVILSFCNHRFFKDTLSIFCEFIPRILFLMSIFGYLVAEIFVKWVLYDAAGSTCAPSLLIGLINMFMFKYPTKKDDPNVDCSSITWYTGQQQVQYFLVVLAGICVPWMLLLKPFILRHRHNKKMFSHHQLLIDPENQLATSSNTDSEILVDDIRENGETSVEPKPKEEEFDFPELMIHQSIHTIEYCLGCISHTASYLRLWALSLAHAQLSEVLWNMVFKMGLTMPGFIGAIVLPSMFAAWAMGTIGVLLLMEGLSAFLHTLRLHWVEFQSKFYGGEGFLFMPFHFEELLKDENIE